MNTVLLKFTFPDEEQIDPNHDLIEALLSSFDQNGQLIDYFNFPVIKENTVTYQGAIILPDSLEPQYHTTLGRERIKRLKEEYQIEFDYEITSEIPRNTLNSIENTTGFFLYEGGISPVRSLDNSFNVPLYLLPPTSEDRTNYHNIKCWERNSEAIFRTWFRGLEGEEYFFDQMANYQSGLSKQGRKLCQLIAELTGRECYYYLHRYPDPDAPIIENCPSCNAPWKLPNELLETFKYKCSNCFLIS